MQGSGEKGLGLAIPAVAIGPGADLNLDQPRCSPPVKAVIDFFSTPAIALLIAVIAGILILGRGAR